MWGRRWGACIGSLTVRRLLARCTEPVADACFAEADPCYSDGVAWMSVTFGADTLESNPFSSCNGIARAGTGIRIFWVNATSATTRFRLTAGLSSSNQNDFYNQCVHSSLLVQSADARLVLQRLEQRDGAAGAGSIHHDDDDGVSPI